MNKQNLWFVALFSIILILSIYYISIPSNTLEELNTITNNETEAVVEESSLLVSLRVSDDEEVLNTINTLENTMIDSTKSTDEKNSAYEELKNINETKGIEEKIESILKDEFSYDSFVKINKDQISVVISSSEHSKDIANNIIKKIQSMFNDKRYITVKFQ